jgi:hypothetical protein
MDDQAVRVLDHFDPERAQHCRSRGDPVRFLDA